MATANAPRPNTTSQAQTEIMETITRANAAIAATTQTHRDMVATIAEATEINREVLQSTIALARWIDQITQRQAEIAKAQGFPNTIKPPAPSQPQAQPPELEAKPWTQAPSQPQAQPRRGDGSPPRTGRAMFAWASDRNQLRAITEIGRRRNFPERIVTWTEAQVSTAYAELFRNDESQAQEDDGYGY